MPAHNPTRKLAEYFKTSFVQNKLSASKSTDKASIIGNIGRLFDGDEENECMINAVRLIADELLRVEPNKLTDAFIGLAVTRLEMHPRETDAGTSRFFNKNMPLQGQVSIVDSLKVRKEAIDAKIVCSNKINLKEADFNQMIRPIRNIEASHQCVFKQHIRWFHRFLQLFGFGKKIETEINDLKNTQKQLHHTFIR